jgi:hypothetical protein
MPTTNENSAGEQHKLGRGVLWLEALIALSQAPVLADTWAGTGYPQALYVPSMYREENVTEVIS